MLSNQTSIFIYEVETCKKVKTLYLKHLGISHIKYTHSDKAFYFIPRQKPFDLYEWSIYDNKIVKRFRGGDMPVKKMMTCRNNDIVFTVDEQNILRIFDAFRED